MHWTRFGGLLLVFALAAPVSARQQADTEVEDLDVHPDTSTMTIAPVVVSGLQPGPRLWKVSRDGRVMWVLGTMSPLPKGLDWAPGETAARLREARC